MFCVPVRVHYRGAAIVSVFNRETKDDKKCIFALVETTTGENESHMNVVSNEPV